MGLFRLMGTPLRVARKTRRVVRTAQVLTGQRTLHLGLFGIYTRKRRTRRPASRAPARATPAKRASGSRPTTPFETLRVNPSAPAAEVAVPSTEERLPAAVVPASPYMPPPLVLLRAGSLDAQPLAIRALLETRTFIDAPPLGVVLGLASNRVAIADLAHASPLLISGPTGSGKSTVLHSLILSLLVRAAHPSFVRMLLVDNNGLELAMYNGMPQLVSPVITDPPKSVGALLWVQKEAQLRYRLMTAARVRTFAEFNALPHEVERLPHLVVIIDHGDSLMAQTELREPVGWILAHGATVGIQTVVTAATRSRIPPAWRGSFAGHFDLQGFADAPEGGHGQWTDRVGAAPMAVRTPQITTAEIAAVARYLATSQGAQETVSTAPSADSDACWDLALRCVSETGQASTSALQRHLRIGYTRAAALIDAMEQKGYIGAADGARPRAVYLTPAMYADIRQNKS